MAVRMNREALLGRLEPVKFEHRDDDGQAHLEQMSLGGALLTLAEVTHEREYELCRKAAQHLLGGVNDPEDIVLE